ncbi:uncharacterized protein LOC103723348 [Phoenix dactylifera]|uniref:Vacuolar iron transporter n=1 Tax=Phoenix dactylifera TaxID=42345 RepID=A0A8B7D3U7_PHODC|nr:uncharacterized protein LOC103723348 [Phoenix dactylifera]
MALEASPPLLRPQHEENGGGVGREGFWSEDSVKSAIDAGLDAIVTSFSLISSISATRLASVDVLVLGFANLVARGISMGFGDFVSTSTENEMAKKERATTEQDVSKSISSQQAGLLSTYQALGLDLEDATTVVNVFSKYQDILVDEKMTAQKGVLPPRQTEKPWKSGLISFAAFILFGNVPLLSFVVLIPFTGDDSTKFFGACLLSALALALLGLARAKISGQYLHSVAATLFNGGIAATCAYLIGWMLRNAAGLHDQTKGH